MDPWVAYSRKCANGWLIDVYRYLHNTKVVNDDVPQFRPEVIASIIQDRQIRAVWHHGQTSLDVRLRTGPSRCGSHGKSVQSGRDLS
jgi:hypothetical protein